MKYCYQCCVMKLQNARAGLVHLVGRRHEEPGCKLPRESLLLVLSIQGYSQDLQPLRFRPALSPLPHTGLHIRPICTSTTSGELSKTRSWRVQGCNVQACAKTRKCVTKLPSANYDSRAQSCCCLQNFMPSQASSGSSSIMTLVT